MESFDDLVIPFLETFLILGVSIFIYRKYFISIFDPLFFFLITQAFSITMGLIQINKMSYLVNFLFCVISFTIGFIIFNPKAKKIDDSNFLYPAKHLKFVSYFNLFAFIIIVLANVILMSQKGLVILSSDPSLAKFSDFDEGGGFGAVRRINFGLANLTLVSIFFTYLKTNKQRNLIMLFVLFLMSLTTGGKGVVLNYIYLIALVGVFRRAELTKAFQRINKVKVPVLVLGFILSIFILTRGGGENGSTMQEGILKLGVRFLYFGDAILYYYEPTTVAHFQHYNFFDFFSYMFNSILGVLRIVEYRKPLGNELLTYYIKDSEDTGLSIGPNTPYYIVGHIFFGGYASLIYSFIIGSIVGYIRKIFFALDKKKVSFMVVIVFIFLNLLVTGLPQDTQLIISVLFDTLVFSLVPLFLAYVFCYLPNSAKLSSDH